MRGLLALCALLALLLALAPHAHDEDGGEICSACTVSATAPVEPGDESVALPTEGRVLSIDSPKVAPRFVAGSIRGRAPPVV